MFELFLGVVNLVSFLLGLSCGFYCHSGSWLSVIVRNLLERNSGSHSSVVCVGPCQNCSVGQWTHKGTEVA